MASNTTLCANTLSATSGRLKDLNITQSVNSFSDSTDTQAEQLASATAHVPLLKLTNDFLSENGPILELQKRKVN